jgi:hypothetical protein
MGYLASSGRFKYIFAKAPKVFFLMQVVVKINHFKQLFALANNCF